KQIFNLKFQIPNLFRSLEFWSLDIVCNLVLGAWDFQHEADPPLANFRGLTFYLVCAMILCFEDRPTS
ncbi:MAG: hypothetical protein COU44_02450, partial [Candidatus Nealsonbacteria bacterium CG10_big_fil_rev_8_21_14_0_10_40_24]